MSDNPFPDVRWGKDLGPQFRRIAGSVLGTRAGGWCIGKLTPLDRWLLERSNGRLTVFGPIAAPLLLLTTTGRKSGLRRRIPLAYMRDGDRLLLVGSNFGQAHDPAWALNLVADPNACVTMGGKEIAVRATQLHGDEADRAYQQFVDYISNYANYQHRAGREIKVFALSPR